MKTIKLFLFAPIFFAIFSHNGFCQNQEIVSETNEFQYLIGMEYSDPTEFDDLIFKGRTEMDKKGIIAASTNYIKGSYQIVTS